METKEISQVQVDTKAILIIQIAGNMKQVQKYCLLSYMKVQIRLQIEENRKIRDHSVRYKKLQRFDAN